MLTVPKLQGDQMSVHACQDLQEVEQSAQVKNFECLPGL